MGYFVSMHDIIQFSGYNTTKCGKGLEGSVYFRGRVGGAGLSTKKTVDLLNISVPC